jgi:hypothetical protein
VFRLLQLDPDTLAMNVNVAGVGVSPHSDQLRFILDEVSVGNFEVVEGFIDSLKADDASYPAAVEFYSSYIHELRHYFDLAVTPYGWYRLRTVFEFYSLIPGMLAQTEDNLVIPLATNRDAIYREAFGLDPLSHSVTSVFLRSTFGRYETIQKHNETRGYYPTGDNILEALAYITQFELVLNKHHSKPVVSRMQNFFSPMEFPSTNPLDVNYRWFIPFVHQLHSNETLPNNRLMYSILFASLCGSIPVTVKPTRVSELPSGPTPTVDRDISEQMPDERFIKLFEHFVELGLPSLQSDAEAFNLVQEACETLFGKSALEEIHDDIAETEKHRNVIAANSESGFLGQKLISAFDDLIHMRKELMKLVYEEPEEFLSSQGFYSEGLKKLRPSLIYWSPQGISQEVGMPCPSAYRNKWIGLVDRKYESKPVLGEETLTMIYAFWSPLRGENFYDKSISDVNINLELGELDDPILSGRQFLYAVHSHLGKYLCYGHNAPGMCEVGSEEILSLLHLKRDDDVLDPAFHNVTRVYPATDFARFAERHDLVCDMCNRDIGHTSGDCVSARTMRQSKLAKELYRSFPEPLCFKLFVTDWSDWFLCEDCMIRLRLPRAPKADFDGLNIVAYSGLKPPEEGFDQRAFNSAFGDIFGTPD